MSEKENMATDYSKIGFFMSENEERYARYAVANSEMDAEEIVWRVNNNLDKEKYQFDIQISDGDDLYVIVNKFFKLPAEYSPSDLVEVDERRMRKAVAKAYVKMRDAAQKEGFSIRVTSAYRSIEEQERLYNKFLLNDPMEVVDETCARPCYSEHHTGLAIDVEGSIPGGRNISKTPEAAWVKENCYRFGFILRYLPEIVDITGYASEPWHLRYIGVQASTDMKEKNIKSFEEYKERFLNTKHA
ncbi:MAG: M15 family metallopeptidase [Clostridia bacterium]|nr:M15 family metallopeptidase [Clostridia bacterium]